MHLQNEKCSISISIDDTYTVNSTDNKHYDYTLNPRNFNHSDFYTTFLIQIDLFYKTISIALIGDGYSYDTNCAILDGDILTVLQDSYITQININDASIVLHKEFDCFGCNFGIYKVKDEYVVYGEMAITMLDSEFNTKWSFYGSDIFATTSNKKAFELTDTCIKLHDFEDNYYELNFDGKLITNSLQKVKPQFER